MALELLLVRHADSTDRLPDQSDFDRTLSSLGQQNAKEMGQFLAGEFPLIDKIISSAAIRAKMSSELMADQLGIGLDEIHYNSEIYEASVRTFLGTICSFDDQWKTVLLVAHNPTVTYFTEYICGEEVGNIATGGAVHIQFDLDHWAEASEGSGKLKFYVDPSSLIV